MNRFQRLISFCIYYITAISTCIFIDYGISLILNIPFKEVFFDAPSKIAFAIVVILSSIYLNRKDWNF